MTYSADDITYVRLLIGDNYDDGRQLFSDTEIGSVIGREPTLKRAAASMLEMIAVSEALTSKKIRTQDLSTDGPALAKTLTDLAAQLRAQSDQDIDSCNDAVTVADYREPWWFLNTPELTEPAINLPISDRGIW